MLFKSARLLVRELDEEDVVLMANWLSDPRVLEYYEGRDRPHDVARVQEKYLGPPKSATTCCIVEWDGAAIGYIQFYPLSAYPDHEQSLYGHRTGGAIYGIDLFIGEPELWGRGIGTELVAAMTEYLFDAKEADKVAIDPQTRNARAIRCYEKAGFRKVKLLPEHELHEGVMRDCWLVERLRERSSRSPEETG